jgi:dUTP pyrophosphatase
MSESVPIKIKRLSNEFDDLPLPSYSTTGSSGVDLRAAINRDFIIPPGELRLIPTNLSVEIPEGYEIQVRPRSGLAAKYGISIVNSPGTIDSDYRGEIKIIMMNLGREEFKISRGDRIAQMVLSKIYKAEFLLSEDLEESIRGNGGFGHTGRT